VIIDDGDDNNSILINNNLGVLGVDDYEFALLNHERDFVYPYQDEPFLGNLRGGIYIILVRDKNGCGVAELEVTVLEMPKFFTPNSDGIRDLWNLEGITQEFIDYFPSSKISVFNRFGKFIADFTIDHPGWNGRYNGQVVMSNDYWVWVELTDRNGNVRVETRNFSLLRR
jgi:gliding motility-associated-like protein